MPDETPAPQQAAPSKLMSALNSQQQMQAPSELDKLKAELADVKALLHRAVAALSDMGHKLLD